MSGTPMVLVKVESHEETARIVVGFLQSNGIDAKLSEDDAGDQLPSLEATRGVQIFVPEGDAERALQLLKEQESQ